jgi:Fibronectin type III domain
VYTPPPDFVGLDSFQYQVSDLNADNTYAARVYIQVGGPGAPSSVTATARNHGATVSWGPADPNGYTITGYTVTALPGGALTTTMSSPVTVTGLTAGTRYHFTVHANMTAPAGTVQMSTKVAASWSGSDESGIGRFDARRAVAAWNGSRGAWTTWNAHLTTSTAYAGTYGRTYSFGARAADHAANLSAWTPSRCTAVPLRSDQLTYTSNFKKGASTSAFAGFAFTTRSHGAVVTRTGIVAKRISLVLTKCSSCGTVQVRWNGAVLASVNTYNGATLHRQVVRVALWPTAHSGRLTATVTSPNGRTVSIEGLAVYNG